MKQQITKIACIICFIASIYACKPTGTIKSFANAYVNDEFFESTSSDSYSGEKHYLVFKDNSFDLSIVRSMNSKSKGNSIKLFLDVSDKGNLELNRKYKMEEAKLEYWRDGKKYFYRTGNSWIEFTYKKKIKSDAYKLSFKFGFEADEEVFCDHIKVMGNFEKVECALSIF